MLFELWGFHSEFFGLIIPRRGSGITYTNQVGGTACMHPKVEGFYVPLPHEWLLEEGNEFIRDFAERKPDPAQLSKLVGGFLAAGDRFLEEYFTVPDEAVDLVAEAWVPVIIKASENNLTTGQLAGFAGILTWSNSD